MVLTTKYLQGHHSHKDPVHPHARYRHRKLSTADTNAKICEFLS
jgi:hypothetical protein